MQSLFKNNFLSGLISKLNESDLNFTEIENIIYLS